MCEEGDLFGKESQRVSVQQIQDLHIFQPINHLRRANPWLLPGKSTPERSMLIRIFPKIS